MSFTSFGRYLTGSRVGQPAAQPEAVPGDAIYGLFAGIGECINSTVITGDNCEHLRSQISELSSQMAPDLDAEHASRVLASISRILSEHQSVQRQASMLQAVEVQHIFAMLNQALIVLAEGSDRSVSRLTKIQESLQRTSLIQDIVALKSSLADTIRFVQTESVQSREAVSEELSRFGTEVTKAREFLGKTRVQLAGRPEGVTRISEGIRNLQSNQGLYAVAYLIDRLDAIKQRYGPEVADEVILRLIKERLQPVAPANTTYRWNSMSIVGVFERVRDLEQLRIAVANLNRTPVVHRIALANRTAVLTIAPSHLVAEGTSDSPFLIKQVDEFTGIHG